MDLYGIIGNPLGHSRSPQYFNTLFEQRKKDARYQAFEFKSICELSDLLRNTPELRGFNVTIPYKQAVLPFLNQLSKEAEAIGAVNCVRIDHINGQLFLTGYNTDATGFRKALNQFIPPHITQALILGNGGAAQAVRYVLHSLHIQTYTVSRHPDTLPRNKCIHETGQTCKPPKYNIISYPEAIPLLASTPLIINTTPLGTWPDTEGCPDLPYHLLSSNHYLFDLVYNPPVTEFMKRGKIAGANTCNGYIMWLEQAKESLNIWEGKQKKE